MKSDENEIESSDMDIIADGTGDEPGDAEVGEGIVVGDDEVFPAPPVAEEEPLDDDEAPGTDEAEAAVEFEGDRPIVRELEYKTPKGAKAGDEEDDAQNPRFASIAEAKAVVEGFLFSCNEPLSVLKLSRLMSNLHPKSVRGLLLELQWEYENRGGALQVIEIAGGYQMCTRAHVAPWMFRLHKHKRRSALSPATLETLAIVAYRQPITKGEIETIRGVESGATLRTLQELSMVEASGRREVIGRPQLYITTEQFLKAFGLKSLGDLPSISELKSRYAEETRLKAAEAAPVVPEPEPLTEGADADAELPDAEMPDGVGMGAGASDEADDLDPVDELDEADELDRADELESFEDEQSLDHIEVITMPADLDEADDPDDDDMDDTDDEDDIEEGSDEVVR